MSSGSLLRLFQSEFFDSRLHMHYLLTMEQSGVQDYLVNQLYKMTDDDVDFYMPQLCQIALLRYKTSLLHRFLLDKAAHSMHFALKIYWLVQAVVEDRIPELLESAMAMVNACETCMVNSAPGRSPCLADLRRRMTHSLSAADLMAEDENDSPTRRRSSSAPHSSSSAPDLDRSGCSDGTLDAQSSPAAAAAAAAAPRVDATAASGGCQPAAGAAVSAMQLRRSCTPPARTRFSPSPRRPSADNHGVIENSTFDWGADCAPGADSDTAAFCTSSSCRSRAMAFRQLAAVAQAFPADAIEQTFSLNQGMPNPYMELGEPVSLSGATSDEAGMEGDMRQFMLKQRRCDYFNTQSQLVSMVTKLSTALTQVQDKSERVSCLTSVLHTVNRWLLDRRAFMAVTNEGPLGLLGLHIPILRQRDTRQQVLRTHPDMCRIFSSATRAPFMLVWETANLDEVMEESGTVAQGAAEVDFDGTDHSARNAKTLEVEAASADSANSAPMELPQSAVGHHLASIIAKELGADAEGLAANDVEGALSESTPNDLLWRYLSKMSPEHWRALRAEVAPMTPAEPKTVERCARCRQILAAQKNEELTMQARTPGADGKATSPAPAAPGTSNCPACRRIDQAVQARHLIWGESWKDRVESARRASPYGHYKSWTLDAVVVKGADDLRQELLAAQVVRVFIEIFKEAKLPLWLKETEVLVTSSNSGLLEFIYDSSSIDSLKKRFPGKSLADIFKVAFADRLFEAKQNFIESCAAYSLLVWFLQVKDRHNGNLMILSSGHVIHIDFGFMLSNSPGGNFGFESSPFKLTQEFLDVMDGECSDQYEYFRTLVIRGFLEARKHMERIILPIRMMLDGSRMPCFREGPDWVLQSLHDRFFVNLTEEACIEKIMDLIDASVNNWRTIQYDTYQRIVNGIL